jgi:hypothetical protein
VLTTGLVLVLAAILLQSSTAGTSSKPYLAGIEPSPVASGVTTTLTFTVTNKANPQTLGSLNLGAPTGFSMSVASYSTDTGNVDSSSTSTLLKLRNLNLAPNATVTVHMETTVPCASGTYTWPLKVKQSNDFNGPPGNDFTGKQPTTIVNGSCTLAWGNEPASAVKTETITSSAYDQGGDPVTVRAVDSNGNTVTTVNGLQVSLGNSGTSTGCPAATGFSGTTTTMSGGVATFTGLTSADAAFDCHLVGSAPGYQSTDPSGSFNISLAKATCSGSVGCSLPGISLNSGTQVDSSTSNGSFQFLAIGPAAIPSTVTSTGGCANFKAVGGAVFDEADGGGSGTKTFRYYVAKSILPKQFQSTSGQQFLPICAGGTRLDGNGKPLNCLDDTAGGWIDKTLDSNGKMTSIYSTAQCDPGTGLWWGILPSFQDINPAGIDPSRNPLVTGWGGTTTARYFDISVPSPWDWRAGT